MADITKCTGEGCSVKNTCYRYTVKADMRQAYFSNPPGNDENCQFYYDKK